MFLMMNLGMEYYQLIGTRWSILQNIVNKSHLGKLSEHIKNIKNIN